MAKGSSQTTGHVMTLANSIIGVAILSMPFCFQRCGIILSILLLLSINITTRICCHYLVKSSILCRRKSMETMSHHIFGPSGKLLVELCTIGYLLGTCVAYFVVVGDIGPQIIVERFELESSNSLRVCVMLVITVICVIPLGLLKNVDSLSTVCMASIGFYCCLVLAVMSEARDHIMNGDWLDHVYWWRWSGVLQCLPIFSLSLSCQMVVFEVYDSVPNATLGRMNEIVKSAISMCTVVYVLVGSFGYVAFCRQEFSGNVLLNLAPSSTSDIIKIGFVLSVAFSFPLVIFPCRASLYSLLFRRGHSEVAHYIPEHRFRLVTFSIIGISLIIGILTPSIELIIGLVGSTIGVAICIMFPASCFIKVGKKDSADVLLAKFLLFFGFVLMILGTYANLVAFEEKSAVVMSDDRALETNTFPAPLDNDAAKSDAIANNVSELLSMPPQPIVHDTYEGPMVLPKEHVQEVPLLSKNERQTGKEIPNTDTVQLTDSPPKDSVDINREAILHEDAEIAAEAKSIVQDGKLQHTKQLVQEIKEIKEQLVKQNQETANLVMKKFDDLAEKVEHIEKVQEQELIKKHIGEASPEAGSVISKTATITPKYNSTVSISTGNRTASNDGKWNRDPIIKRFEMAAALKQDNTSHTKKHTTDILVASKETRTAKQAEQIREVPLSSPSEQSVTVGPIPVVKEVHVKDNL